jgi:hypothetical protein
MLADIYRNGLRNPVLLNHSNVLAPDNPFPERPEFCVNAGNHRVMAALLLEWQTIPALVWGFPPKIPVVVGPLTIGDVQQYLEDGRIVLDWHGPILKDAIDPREEFGE